MDENANIYGAPEDEISAEDKARLDGYLNAKAEDGELARMQAKLEAALETFEERANQSDRPA